LYRVGQDRDGECGEDAPLRQLWSIHTDGWR
jgi:hypothetical protein